ncbi:MAG: phosphatase PAP2 family protein [Gemmatimonadota bacterium]
MDRVLPWGYTTIQWFQAYRSPFLDSLFLFLSFLGEEFFYLLVIPGLYWLVSRRFALRFAVLLLVSVWVNDLLKIIADQPRPSVDRVDVLGDITSGGFPSGHAQNAVVTWGLVAWRWRAPEMVTAMFILILGIGVSRVYLGLHFPHDVLAGWAVGAGLLYLAIRAGPPLEGWGAERKLSVQMATGLAVVAVLLLIHRGDLALRAGGALAGISVGAPLEWARVRFLPPLGARRKMWAFLLGTTVALVIWFGARAAFFFLGEAGVFLRYAAVGVWITLGAPWLFVTLRLARRREGSGEGDGKGEGAGDRVGDSAATRS